MENWTAKQFMCEWAQREYSLDEVGRVELTFEPPIIGVEAFTPGGTILHESEMDPVALITRLAEFGAGILQRQASTDRSGVTSGR